MVSKVPSPYASPPPFMTPEDLGALMTGSHAL
jgi:hypothetical protein